MNAEVLVEGIVKGLWALLLLSLILLAWYAGPLVDRLMDEVEEMSDLEAEEE